MAVDTNDKQMNGNKKKQIANTLSITENQLTAMCFQWAWNQYPKTRYCLFHVVNEGKRSLRYGAQQKAMGLVSGVPDFCFVWNGNVYFCELKVDNKQLSKEQKNVHTIWKNQKVEVVICRTIDEFMKWFENILNKSLQM